MNKMGPKEWKKVKFTKKVVSGKPVDVAIYQKGKHRIEIPLNQIDHIERITSSPRRWLKSHPVIPLGEKDERGEPLYKVIKLNDHIARSKKPLKKVKIKKR